MDVLKSTYQLEVVNRIKALRISKDLSQIKVANLLDVSNGFVGNVESPKYRHKYTLKQLWILAKYFGVSLDYILTGKEIVLSSEQIVTYLISYDE